ncbi:MAG: mechanosensitive ion channel [Clostridia bacterium]|nr:mechanosensitive ion channel [Clostridia bacterium]
MKVYPLDLAELIRARDWEGIYALIISKLPLIVAAAVILIVGFLIANLLGKLLVKALEAKGVDPSVHHFLRVIFQLVLKFAVVLSALSALHVNVNSLVAAVGAAGVTAGLGLQASISQIASGIQILLHRPFKSGDYIDIGDVSGNVQEIKMMYTTLITLDHRRVIVPNSHITDSNIINFTAEELRRIDLEFSVSYDADIEDVRRVLTTVTAVNPLILEEPAPVVAVKGHGESAIKIICMIWCHSTDYWPVFYYMQEEVKLAFDKNGISIPYSQLDLHIVKDAKKQRRFGSLS